MFYFENFILIILLASVNYATCNIDKCIDSSFDVKLTLVPDTFGIDQNKISFTTSIVVKDSIKIPTEFKDDKEYQSQCFEKVILKIFDVDNNKNVGEKAVTSSGLVIFESLSYFKDYEIKSEYKQKNSNKLVESTSFKSTTCYGEPSNVRNLEVTSRADKGLLVNWEQPIVINAPNVCFYEVTVKDLDQNKIISIKKTSMTNMEIDAVDAIKPIEISVISFNSLKFDKKSCYQKPIDRECRDQSSKAEYISYRPSESTSEIMTSEIMTTTKDNNGSTNRFQLLTFVSAIFSLFFLYL